MSRVMVTGGAGYIGSHTCVELLNAGHKVVVYDNFSNSSPKSLKRVKDITGKDFAIITGDICDEAQFTQALKGHNCDAVIHFAGLKAVGESNELPLDYFYNNVTGTVSILKAMKACNVKQFVFSSSATVYGNPRQLPIPETHPLSTTNPYGRTKLIIEKILEDLYASDETWRISVLRYFNPCGAHESGKIGESPNGVPNNLVPYIAQVASKKRDQLRIWGDNYDTPDGTGVRDYIHVVDLALGHLKALEYITNNTGTSTVNLGTGNGYSVLQMLKSFSDACGDDLSYEIMDRRPGDVASCYANADLAHELYGWSAIRDLKKMCTDHWRWQSLNPDGFSG